jgi:phosphonate transport system substrate-binding protein
MTEEPTEEPMTLGTEDDPIVMSFVPSGDADAVIASADAITEALSEATGLVIEANVPTSYVGSIEAMCAGEAHIGTLNTFSYVVAAERGCADVAVASTRFGSPTYTGQMIARADSGIATIEDLAGKTFCRVDEFSTSGWIIPSITMRAAGVDPDTDLTEIVDAGGHPDVVRAVYNGDCDAGATFVDARTNVQEELADVMEVVVVFAESDAIPNDTVSFIPDFPEEMRTQIVEALLAMTENPDQLQMLNDLYRWEGLVEVDDTFYDGFRQLLEASGVNVEDFVGE